MTKVNSNGDTENHVHNFDYKSVIGRSDGPMIDLENCDRFRTLINMIIINTIVTYKELFPLKCSKALNRHRRKIQLVAR